MKPYRAVLAMATLFATGWGAVPAHSGTTTGITPTGPAGTWTQVFGDEFDDNSLDATKWTRQEGWMINNVTTRATNVTESGGSARLRLSDANNGAQLVTHRWDGDTDRFSLKVGDFVEARVNFPGDNTGLHNWPAWWVSGPSWPAAGEHDIAEEVEGGLLTVNYHRPARSSREHTTDGTAYVNSFHVYGLHRKATSADVYWDGKLVASYPTADNGQGQALILTVGRDANGAPVTGAASEMQVDYVRAWR